MPPRPDPAGDGSRSGQSLIESCVIVCLIGVLFAGLFQISQLFAAREILFHAAARGARAKTVGFNDWMVQKSIRVAAIPNAGRMTEPAFQNVDAALRQLVTTRRPGELWDDALRSVPSSLQLGIELSRIPQYMDSDNVVRGSYLLDYADWDTVHHNWADTIPVEGSEDAVNPVIHIHVSQDVPLRIPLHRTFYASNSVTLRAEAYIENHYPLYIDDMDW